MSNIGKTRYLKNLNESASLGRQLAQTYLIVVSLLFPQLITVASESSNVNFKSYIFLIFFVFLIAILEYLGMSSIVIAKDFNLSLTNAAGIVACMSLSFLICSYFIIEAPEYAVAPNRFRYTRWLHIRCPL